jgi:hypothetical protein
MPRRRSLPAPDGRRTTRETANSAVLVKHHKGRLSGVGEFGFLWVLLSSDDLSFPVRSLQGTLLYLLNETECKVRLSFFVVEHKSRSVFITVFVFKTQPSTGSSFRVFEKK